MRAAGQGAIVLGLDKVTMLDGMVQKLLAGVK